MARHPDHDPDETLEVELQCSCLGSELTDTMRGMRITANLRVFQDASPAIIIDTLVARLRKLENIWVSLHLSPLRLNTECSAREEPWPSQKSNVGPKRGLLETTDITTFLHLLHRHYKAPSQQIKRFRGRGSDLYRKARDIKTRKMTNLFIHCKVEIQYISKSIFKDMLPNMPCLKSLSLANEVTNLSNLDLPELQRWWLKDEHLVISAKKRKKEVLREEAVPTDWNSLSFDVQDKIFQKADLKTLFRCKALSKACKHHIESDAFCQSRGETSEGSFTAISYYIRDNAWQCSGYDVESNTWRSLPTFSYLPAPDADLFKEFSVSGHRSLMCGHLSKLPAKGELVVFNPLTGKKRVLPSLLYPRNPVLVHISVDSGEKSYTVVVAGSSSACDEHLSKKVEVFRSTTSKWTEAGDVPGPVFGLNEHQAGVSINGILYLIAFLEGSCHRGVVAFDVESGKWLEDRTWAIPFSLHSNNLQLVECSGKVHLFSEQERGSCVEHCIDVLDSALHSWRNVVRVKSFGGRGLQVYPEHTCVSFGEGKLCVFNTLSRDGVVYDMWDGKQVAALPPPPANQKGDRFFTLNPASFTLQPRFDTKPTPPI